MQRFLVEVTLPEAVAADRIAAAVRSIGSHFATHADWRRRDGVCTGSMIVEAANRWGAFGVVPPGMRAQAHIYRLESVSTAPGPTGLGVSRMQPYATAA